MLSCSSYDCTFHFGYEQLKSLHKQKRPRKELHRAKNISWNRSMTEIEVCNIPRELSEDIIRECIETFPRVRFKATGSCMHPVLVPGMTVLVGRPELHPPRIGDIVLLRHPAGLRLHRLLWGPPIVSRRSSWRTKPDRTLAWDPWISPDGIFGTVVGTEGQSGIGPGQQTWAFIRWVGGSLSKRFHRGLKHMGSFG
jgi:hypothetical protein